MEKIKKAQSGITMISLVVTVIILMILTGMLIYNTKDTIEIEALTNLYNDIDLLKEKVSNYYNEYGQIPKLEKYPKPKELSEILSQKNDTGNFYVIDLEAMQGITLNYGKDYETIKTKKQNNENYKIEEYKNIYIINENSHNIFYVQGISIRENNTSKTYYTNYTTPDETTVDLRYIEGILIPEGYYYICKEKDNLGNESIVISNEKENTETAQKYIWKKQISNIANINEISNIELSENQKEDELIKSINHYKGYFKNKNEESKEIIYLPIKENKWSETYTKTEKYVDKNGDTAYIPKGFRVSIAEGTNEIRSGLVITDKVENNQSTGNEYIWVPVENFEDFKREDFGPTKINESNFITEEPTQQAEQTEPIKETETSKEATETKTEEKYYEPIGDGEKVDETAKQSIQEVQNMYKSIKKYKGFYIGRYETGINEEAARTSTTGINQQPVVQKNKNIYNYIKWGNSITDEKGGAVEKARNIYTETTFDGIQSTLCYGVQWDAIMRWINRDTSLRYIFTENEDNYKKGNYDTSGKLIKTGNNEFYQIKNIYDIAGNVSEWTMETYGINKKVVRGGKSGSKDGITFREESDVTENSSLYGFRIALYIK